MMPLFSRALGRFPSYALLAVSMLCLAYGMGCTSSANTPNLPSTMSRSDSDLERLRVLCLRDGVSMVSDLGVLHAYSRSSLEMYDLIVDLAKQSDAVTAIESRYCASPPQSAPQVDFRFVFPLLEVLLRIEQYSGQSNRQIRKRLWLSWRIAVPESNILFRYTLSRYEEEILSRM
jgi:hypothetical protein